MERAKQPSFGEALRQHRRRLGLTQEELAERAELSVRQLAYLERGAHAPRPGTVRRLADALGLAEEDHAVLLAAVREDAPEPMATERVYLPAQPTRFIGREREVAAITGLLLQENIRLLTLNGPGGTGKTRLAIQAAGELVDDFPDGVVFVSLAALTRSALVVSAIAASLGVKEAPGRSPIEGLQEYLRPKRLLLLLDNFEHLLPAATLVSDLLAACPGLTVLVTSRAALHLAAEHAYAVPPLAIPDGSQTASLGALIQYDAVALFVERARAARATFALTPENAPAVVEVCRQVDGLPLAIVLAAAWTGLFSPQALRQRLGSRLSLLTRGATDLPARQQTLRATIDWSYGLLDEAERRLLARLSVFAGGCTLEAAGVVCNPDGNVSFLETVASLIDKSLVRQEGDQEPRLLLLEVIREYAAEKLEAYGDVEAVRSAHAECFLRLAERAEPELRGSGQAEWLIRLKQELDNARTAMRWWLDRGDAERELRLAAALLQFWSYRGYWTEGLHWLEDGLAESGEVTPPVRAKAYLSLGNIAALRADNERADTVLQEALRLFRDHGDRRGSAQVLSALGNVAGGQGQYQRAKTFYEESLRVWTDLGDDLRSAGLMVNLGITALVEGDLGMAREQLEKGLIGLRAAGDAEPIAMALQALAAVASMEGDDAGAERFLLESLRLGRTLGTTARIAGVLGDLAEIALRQGSCERALQQARDALLLARELGDRYLSLELVATMGALALATGQTERAARLKGAELAIREQLRIPAAPVSAGRDEKLLSDIRAAPPGTALVVEWQEGQNMNLEEAVAYALHEDSD